MELAERFYKWVRLALFACFETKFIKIDFLRVEAFHLIISRCSVLAEMHENRISIFKFTARGQNDFVTPFRFFLHASSYMFGTKLMGVRA